MTGSRILSAALGVAGLITLAGALGWWWLSYHEVYAYNYLSLGQAGLCLVGESEICRLAASLCRGRHESIVAAYSSGLLWFGVALLSASLVTPGQRLWGSRDGQDPMPLPKEHR